MPYVPTQKRNALGAKYSRRGTAVVAGGGRWAGNRVKRKCRNKRNTTPRHIAEVLVSTEPPDDNADKPKDSKTVKA